MTREITLTRGYVALVDDVDFEAVVALGPWHVSGSGLVRYARHSFTPQRQILLHTFLTGWAMVDHVNGEGLDNRRANLRAATRQQNSANSRLRRDNPTGFRGVAPRQGGRFWIAVIGGPSTREYLGFFDSKEEAARAYDRAALVRFGEFARLNFPKETAA